MNPNRALNECARRKLAGKPGEPLFIADWDRVLFMHFEIDPNALQREIPFELDLCEGRAYVSLVAFTMRGMRPRFCGRWGALLFRPVATQHFLNVRTYVRHRGEPGIFFIREWLSSRVCVPLGPIVYGLPYHFAAIAYQHDHERGRLRGIVQPPSGIGRLEYSARLPDDCTFGLTSGHSLSEFLLERYTAFTNRRGQSYMFRIWHLPWEQVPVQVEISDASLMTASWDWFRSAEPAGGHYSPGASSVWMGWPRNVSRRTPVRARTRRTFLEMP